MADVATRTGTLVGHLGGSATVWAVELGLRHGLFAELAGSDTGLTKEEVAERLDLDPLYTHVVLRMAFAGEILDRSGDRYVLDPDMATLLLDQDSPAYMGGHVRVVTALRETWLDYREFMTTGQREWWADFDPEWIEAVGDACQTFYTRMVGGVIPEMPAVQSALEAGGRYLDLACGTCRGVRRVLAAYPSVHVTAVDGDRYSLDLARKEAENEDNVDQFTFVESWLEDLELEPTHDLAIINVSLHEAKDPAKVIANVKRALKPGGTFLISEFPFPEDEDDCRTPPNRLMCGIQAFEAHIDCQLKPTSFWVDLLQAGGFEQVDHVDVNPTHVVVHGVKP